MINNKKVYSFSAASLLSAAMCCLAMLACGGGQVSTKRVLDDNYRVQPGVDSTVAREADSLQVFLFVDAKKEKKIAELKAKAQERLQRSDSLWAKISLKNGISTSDSLTASSYTESGKSALNAILGDANSENSKKINSEAYKKIGIYLDEAAASFEQAILINPNDLEARGWLARVYGLKAERFENEQDYSKAAQELENLLQLEKSKHEIYFQLAENYFRMKAWKPAYDIFVDAERVLKETAFLNVNDPEATMAELKNAPVDTSVLFIYRYYQGIAQSRLYHADNALEILQTALALAPTDQERASVESYLDWINWDNGNIRGSEIRDSLLVLQNEEQFASAENGFKRLVKSLKTQKARDEIEWRAAVLAYEKLGQKDDAVKSLHELIDRTETLEDGLPVDTSYQRYFEDYSIMCYNLGLEYASKRNWQDAYAYFLQASQINWKGQAKCNVEIAKIVQNNPDLVIKHLLQAQEKEQTLSLLEKQQLYQLLSVAYLKKGMIDEAREIRKKLLNLQKESRINDSASSM
ncbi:MAG: hypothetical protein H6695_12665 [Deferribacteres bacterium]|nr:hypothetical protein [candidate division KSB1 bacterium]MCB9511035.1 hypothetical protein [Deferribacteres bacterium]